MSKISILNENYYSTKNPITVRHASLLNAVKDLQPEKVYYDLMNSIDIFTKKTKNDENLSILNILQRDSKWVKKMFMGVNGIDVTMTAVKRKKREPTKKIEKKQSTAKQAVSKVKDEKKDTNKSIKGKRNNIDKLNSK